MSKQRYTVRERLSSWLRAARLGETRGRCVYCDRITLHSPNLSRSHEADHYAAESVYGRCDISRTVPACRACNSIKKDKSLREFATLLEACGEAWAPWGSIHGQETVGRLTVEVVLKRATNCRNRKLVEGPALEAAIQERTETFREAEALLTNLEDTRKR